MNTSGNVALKLVNVDKAIGKRKIIKDLSFETYEGEVFGFLGPNGAGKTTTIKMIVGMRSVDNGQIYVCGENIEKNFEKAMKNIGAIVENPEMYTYMSGLDNLKQYARMRENISDERIMEVVKIVGLSNRINESVKRYSLGMKQRLGLAQAMLHKPKVIVLDEPTNGLDPAGIKLLRDILKKLAHEEKCCVFVSSHLMSEMELMCDRIGIIVDGKLNGVKTIEEMLSENARSLRYRMEISNITKAKEILEDIGLSNIVLEDNKIEFDTDIKKEVDTKKENMAKINNIIKKFVEEDIDIFAVEQINKQSLEEAFMELTKDGGGQIV